MNHLLIACILFLAVPLTAQIIPAPKVFLSGAEITTPTKFDLRVESEGIRREAAALRDVLLRRGIDVAPGGVNIHLRIADVPTSETTTRYHDEIARQAYAITIDGESVLLEAASPEAMFYAVSTFDQLLAQPQWRGTRIVDWPDLPLRMIMIDAARQNENFDYYRKVIDFAAQHKLNAILCHLTDDQTSALHHEGYPELMHPQAWKADDIRELVAYARERHIQLIPEIESLGHSRMFTRRDDYADFLHQRLEAKRTSTWTGTDIEGYTNVLCPASDSAAQYLSDIYAAAETFDYPWLHIGFDEVDITTCTRCREAFGDISKPEWIRLAYERAHDLARRKHRKVALWGDMLLAHRDAIESISPEDTIIFDWHYNHDVTDASVSFFDEKGFEIVASPSLVCAPHVILPDLHNFQNIERFTRIADEHDLLGINTTIWIPTRYLSDVLWTGIAYASSHAWGGSNFNESDFFEAFTRDYFGSTECNAYRAAWQRMSSVVWHIPDYGASCWHDEATLEKARAIAATREDEITAKIAELDAALDELERITPTVTRHREEWDSIAKSVRLLRYTMKHLLAARHISGDAIDRDLLTQLDRECQTAIEWIEEDWAKNRYSNDPNMEGLYLTNQHILFQFKQMRDFHRALLSRE